jgi:LEA14-like dessication related protein
MRKSTMSAANALMLSVAAATIVLSGCASVGRKVFKEPVVTLKEMRVVGVGFNGGSLDVLLNVHNPNGYSLDATKLTYKVMIDSLTFGQGELDSKFVVQENDSAVVRLPLQFTWAGVGEAGRQLMGTGTVNYRVSGVLAVGTPIGTYNAPYDRTGRYTLLR